MAKTGETPVVKRFGFIDYLEAWITGLRWARNNPDIEDERLLKAAQECYEKSGSESGKRLGRALTGKQFPEIDLSVLTELQQRMLKIFIVHMVERTSEDAWIKIARELGVSSMTLKKHAAELNEIFNGKELYGDHG